MSTITTIDRRGFLKLTGLLGGDFVLAAVTPRSFAAVSDDAPLIGSDELNAFIRVTPEGKIIIYSANAEMGQGVKTALPMVIADGMGARWSDVEVLQSPVDEKLFGQQMAGGSTTIPRLRSSRRSPPNNPCPPLIR
jgi:isoquinoline 1-oxidoreductase beta subunit